MFYNIYTFLWDIMNNFYKILDFALGLDPSNNSLTFFHMSMRALVVYTLGIFIIKAHKRFMELRTVFNYFLYILLGSMLASSITNKSPFFHTLATVIIIMMVNGGITIIVYFFPFLERLLKGTPDILIKNGKIDWKNMRKNFITQGELWEALHNSNVNSLDNVEIAYFENNGSITVISKK